MRLLRFLILSLWMPDRFSESGGDKQRCRFFLSRLTVEDYRRLCYTTFNMRKMLVSYEERT